MYSYHVVYTCKPSVMYIYIVTILCTHVNPVLCPCAQMLCAKGAHMLQTKSQTVEEAANELINMLCDVEPPEPPPETEEEEDAGFDEEETAEG